MTSTLGKRKTREEGEEKDSEKSHGSTLFVSNLPYTATSVDLQTLFSDIAPVRSAFVVTEHGTGVSKGVGYVSFAIKEDAQAAYEKIGKEGMNFVGRNLRVEWAESKPKNRPERGKESEKDADTKGKKDKIQPKPKPKTPQVRGPNDPLAIRTIVVSGLPSSIDAKSLWKKMRKIDGAEKVDWPVKREDGENDSTMAHVVFSSPAQALDAVSKLHAHVFKGCLLSVTLKKRLDDLAKLVAKPSTSKAAKDGAVAGGEEADKKPGVVVAAPNHASRLIVRNLPWDITEQDLRAVFLPYGPIYSIHIPLAEPKEGEAGPSTEQVASSEPKKKPRMKGFAFIWMLSRKDAEKAIEGCNGKQVSAGTAEALVSEKQKKKKLIRLEKKSKVLAANAAAKGWSVDGEKGEDEVDEDGGEDGEEKETGKVSSSSRVIAVDWALSKDKWEEEKAKIEQDGEDVEMADAGSNNEEGDASDEDAETGSSDESEDEHIGVHEGSDDDESGSDEDDDEEARNDDEDKPVKPQLPDTDVGTTIFVRNVPYTATDDELRTLFRAFGPLRYARITMDPATGRSRGTGFACFWNREDADKVIEQSNLLREVTTGHSAPVKKNPFSMPSLLTPDPSSSLAQSLVLQGRTLDAVRAVTRDEAGKLKEDGEKSRQKADKRNMYLLREGVILPNSPQAANLAPQDLERRTNSHNARRTLLKSNPSLYISKTRLSIRQIPLYVTERMLKRLAIHATRAFEAEVKEGKRTALTADELSPSHDIGKEEQDLGADGDGEDKNALKKTQKKKRFMGRETGVKQTKIVRQQERVDPITGKGRSKGYGFLEMHKHADALRVLRWSNDNPTVGLLFEEWWKDELKEMVKRHESGDGKTKGKQNVKEEKGDKEMDEARLARVKAELEKGDEGKKKRVGGLIVEFSIENIQVVQRRNARPQVKGKEHNADDDSRAESRASKLGPRKGRDSSRSKPKVSDGDDDVATTKSRSRPKDGQEGRPKKRPRLSTDSPEKSRPRSTTQGATDKIKPSTKEEQTPTKVPNVLGHLIGRKRKERQKKR
ncbi:hypothetical protein BDN72DRAFT_819174 [Pluteus cervinus]|uniref:Uncharacterized protein n=1 Tax=Pluteus cervinus TaxID=181527 RepID=A0ACD3AWT9_9AGAR|nr:hypothetical protein BDN72DRAFT_819174 [Pluteus cervinus]